MAKWVIFCFCIAAVSVMAADGMGTAMERETPVVRAVRKVEAAVVNISTEKVVSVRDFNPFGNDWIFEYFNPYRRPQRNVTRQSLGSGVIIDPEGIILTNEHVILPASKINVTLADGREFEAELVGAARRFDLALLKIETGESLPYLSPATSSDLMIGETVIAIGNPFGLSSTVTTGVLSAKNRTITFQDEETRRTHTYYDFLQTDASINPGNSGGPLLNILGELVGINTAIYARAEGIGFAIPIDKAKRIIDDLLELGEVPRIWLGLQVQDLNDVLMRHLGIDRSEGVLVSEVRKDSPARIAGLMPGDQSG
ncbi:MAG TPA: trypsin-like peptidase domain-containing protein, partial [bacterium]|nr:trypsin-like peptidase domain-containing protein [bacterium]